MWLTQAQIAELFGTKQPAISKHLSNIYREGELEKESTYSILEYMGRLGKQSYRTGCYNLDAILSVGYRVNSRRAVLFRQWASRILKEYLLHGIVNPRDDLAAEMDRRFANHEKRLAAVEKRVDFVIESALPPPEMVFCEGEFLSAHEAILKIVKAASRRLVLIDNYIDERVLTLLSQRRPGVTCEIYGKNAASPEVQLALERYREQFSDDKLTVTAWNKAHDRFIICDDTVWLCGASVKDAGRRMFALVKTGLRPDIVLKELP